MKEKTIELGKVRQGERFKLDGVEFVKLDCDEEATFVLTADTLPECCAFEDDDAEREDHNNFSGRPTICSSTPFTTSATQRARMH